MCAPDDLDGAATTLDVTGAERVLILQVDNGTAGTTGIDSVQISHDGGKQWVDDPTVLAVASDEFSGTVLANGALNAAGVEPTGGTAAKAAAFKSGPHNGPTLIRVSRLNTEGTTHGAAWTTGAPGVYALVIR